MRRGAQVLVLPWVRKSEKPWFSSENRSEKNWIFGGREVENFSGPFWPPGRGSQIWKPLEVFVPKNSCEQFFVRFPDFPTKLSTRLWKNSVETDFIPFAFLLPQASLFENPSSKRRISEKTVGGNWGKRNVFSDGCGKRMFVFGRCPACLVVGNRSAPFL